jgi:microcystin-dependent protein
MWPDAAAPAGWFLCQGQTVPAASNPGLAAIFGTSGGNVTVPDLRGRVLVGAAPVNVPATGDPARALRAKGGLSTVKLKSGESGVPAHSHPVDGGRSLPAVGSWALVNANYGSGLNNNDIPMRASFGAGFTSPNAVDNNTVADAATAHENMPPYYAINYIIRGG